MMKSKILKVIAAVISTWLFIYLFYYLFGKVWGINSNVSVGTPLILSAYFWGGYFLFRKTWQKAIGIIFYTLAVLFNFVMLASPYDIQKEFISTRVFILFGWAAGIFLIVRKGWASIILGILVIILTLPMAILGSIFMYGKLHP